MPLGDTIVAIATPAGRSALGIVRLSGPGARQTAQTFLSPIAWKPGAARLAELRDKEGRVVDQVMVTFFASPRSFTAEDVVEISCHGSPVLLRHAVERAVASGARLAEPGEFTMRAFLNGRLDLPQAEAVRDLIEATTTYQARVAAQQTSGSVSRRIAPLKEQLLQLILVLEAGIDFAEDDIQVASAEEIQHRLAPVEAAIAQLISSFTYGGLVQRGITLAIVGPPNVGKSSLFNRLLEQDRAIVTAIPGTTRDVVSETAAIEGLPVKLYDTAGIRETDQTVEALGIERSYQAMADADVTLIVSDLSVEREAEEDLAPRVGGKTLRVGNKCDLPHAAPRADVIQVSALSGEGIDRLRAAILESVAPAGAFEQETGFITNVRHEQLLRESATYLAKAREAVASAIPHEMILLDLYAALKPIDAITGATTADDILNRIFSTFCIGK